MSTPIRWEHLRGDHDEGGQGKDRQAAVLSHGNTRRDGLALHVLSGHAE